MKNTRRHIFSLMLVYQTFLAASCNDTKPIGSRVKSEVGVEAGVGVGLEAIKVENVPADQDGSGYETSAVAVEPTMVGGAYLSCSINYQSNTTEIMAVSCSLPDTEDAAKLADRFAYNFSLNDVADKAGLALVPLSIQANVDVVNKVWKWDFNFKRSLVTKPWLYIEITDKLRSLEGLPSYKYSLATTGLLSMQLMPAEFWLLGDNPAIFPSGGFLRPGCPDNIRIAGAQTPGTKETFSRKIKVMSASAQVQVNLGVCGINTAGDSAFFKVDLLPKSGTEGNTALATNVFSAEFRSDRNNQFDLINLVSGEYNLTVSAGFYSNRLGFDDIAITSFNFLALSGEVALLPLPTP